MKYNVVFAITLGLALALIPSIMLADSQFQPSSPATLFTTVKDGAGNPVNNATVTVTLRDWQGTAVFTNQTMTYLTGSWGKYAYNFTTPSTEGAYIAESCAVGYGYGSETVLITASGNITYSGNFTGANVTDPWGVNASGYTGGLTFGGLFNSLIGGLTMLFEGNPIGIPQMMLVITLCILAVWKRGWIRILLSICIIIWGIFAFQSDVKVAAPLVAIGSILFIEAILRQIQHAREEQAE